MSESELGPQRVTQEAILALVKRSGLSHAEAREVLEKEAESRAIAAKIAAARALEPEDE